jgi:hypothetical protein
MLLKGTIVDIPVPNNSLIEWKPLNVITLGQRESDNINRLKTLTKQAFRLVDCKNAKWALDNFNLLITLTE